MKPMPRRDFLLASSASIAAVAMGAGAGACANTRRLQSRIAPLRDLMATRVGQNQFPGAVWLVAHGGDVAVIVMTQSPDFLFTGGRDAFWRGAYAAVA